MLYLVKDILDCSDIKILQLLEECISVLQFKANDKGIRVYIDEESQFTYSFHADSPWFKQIIINLVSNAVKYTQEWSVKISDRVEKAKVLSIMVENTGVGMSEDCLKQSFSSFSKIMANKHLKRVGVGLGLEVGKNLAHALGGDIHAYIFLIKKQNLKKGKVRSSL